MNKFNNHYCQHNIPAISCLICNAVQPKQYNQFDTQIVRYEVQIQAYKELIKAQEEKIISLSFDLEYAKRTIENLTVEEPKKKEYYDEDDDIFRKEQVEKFYAEARPLREKYKPRELTDEEIIDAWKMFPNWGHEQHILMFGRELLKKASEK